MEKRRVFDNERRVHPKTEKDFEVLYSGLERIYSAKYRLERTRDDPNQQVKINRTCTTCSFGRFIGSREWIVAEDRQTQD